MKKMMFLLALAMCNITLAFCQTDTSHATLHPMPIQPMAQQYGIQACPFIIVIYKSGHIAFSGNTDMGDVAGQPRSVIEAMRN